MADVEVSFPEINTIREMLRDYPKAIRRKYTRAAFTAAAKPGVAALRRLTPRGPTGNLKRSVVAKSNENYALAGYRAAGRGKNPKTNKSYHQGFLEFGTDVRKIRVPSNRGIFIASSFNDRKPFRLFRRRLVRGERKVQQSSPKYPQAFFKSSKFGQPLMIPRMPIGGRLGKPPVAAAFQASRSQIQSVLSDQMTTVLERANKDMARRAK